MTTLPCHITWNPDVSPFSIGDFEIRYYSICWIAAIGIGYLIMQHLYKKQGKSEVLFEPLFMYCFIGILLGARLGHCLFYEPQYYLSGVSNFLEMLLPVKITGSGWEFIGYQGLASHGGTIGLFLGLLAYSRKYKVPFLWVLDNIAITTPIAAAFIRLGNFMNSEILGRATDSPLGIIFAQVDNVPRHPAQLYEAIAYLLFFVVGWILYRFRDNDQTLYGDDNGNVYLLSSSRSADEQIFTNVKTGETVSGNSVAMKKIYNGETDTTNLCHNKGIYDNHMEPYEEMMTSMKKISDNLVSLIDYFSK